MMNVAPTEKLMLNGMVVVAWRSTEMLLESDKLKDENAAARAPSKISRGTLNVVDVLPSLERMTLKLARGRFTAVTNLSVLCEPKRGAAVVPGKGPVLGV